MSYKIIEQCHEFQSCKQIKANLNMANYRRGFSLFDTSVLFDFLSLCGLRSKRIRVDFVLCLYTSVICFNVWVRKNERKKTECDYCPMHTSITLYLRMAGEMILLARSTIFPCVVVSHVRMSDDMAQELCKQAKNLKHCLCKYTVILENEQKRKISPQNSPSSKE